MVAMTPEPVWRWRVLAFRFVAALAIMSLATVGTLGYAYWFANDQVAKIRHPRLDPGLIQHVGATQPANYLIVGSDTRAFVHDAVAADHFGTPRTNPENLADVIMIAHVDPRAPGRGFLVSIPRDTWVPIAGHGTQKINAAFSYGASTLIRTIQDNFRFHINHYLKLDFATFTDVVNAIGKVHLFFPAPAFDAKTGLYVKTAGCVPLDGLEALAYARSRYYQYKTATSGNDPRYWAKDGRSDIGRIGRQQYFIRSLASEAIKKGARNPLTAKTLVEKIVPHLEADPGMGLRDFFGLVLAFRSVDPGAVKMVTIPTATVMVGATSTQQLLPVQAAPIFALLGNFTRSPGGSATKVDRSQIRVRVLNGSGVLHVAGTAATALHAAGFASGGAPGDADQHDYVYTQVRYTAGNLAKAEIVASYLGGAGLLEQTTSAAAGADVVVVLGADFVGIAAPGSHPKAPTGSTVTTVAANPGTTPGVTAPPPVAGRPAVGCT